MPRVSVQHSEGREFYDDGYDSDGDSVGNRLDFSKVAFYGRQQELDALHNIFKKGCWQRSGAQQPPFPLVAGFSGTGKSTLVKRFIDKEKKDSNGKLFSLCGKYSEINRDDPFQAIVDAFNGFLSEIKESKSELEEIRQKIKKSTGDEAIGALQCVIPGLKDFIGADEEAQAKSSLPAENTRNRLKYAFQSLLKAISSRERPLVMFLDDLQWADNASLELIQSLLTDTSLRNVMLIGAIRSCEVDEHHPLMKLLEETSEIRTVERIDLLNLSMEEIGEFICDLLELNKDEAMPLTEVVYSKTRGNVFFTSQMLEDFYQKNVIYYSMISFQWEWNLKDIQSQVETTDDVVDIVASRIKSTPEKLQKALTVAAHVRSSIDVDSLKVLMEMTGCHVSADELVKLLDVAVVEGMMTNTVGSTQYKFAHDKIQQAARSLVDSEGEKQELRLKIGHCLFEIWSSNSGADWMLFVAADHLNSVALESRDPLLAIQLNLEAGEKAFSVAAFVQASAYLKRCVHELNNVDDHWVKHYDMSLRIYRVMANVELALGHFEVGNELCKQVLNKAKTNDDKFPTYISLAPALLRENRPTEAADCCWAALEMLGEKRKKFLLAFLLKDLLLVSRQFKTHTDDEILAKPLITDEKLLTTLRFYDEASTLAYASGNLAEFMLITLRRLHMTFKHGLCASSALAVVNYASYAGMTGDHQMALRLARLARKLIVVTKARHMEPIVLFVAAHYTEGWSSPCSETIMTFQKGTKAGMEIGDMTFAFSCWMFSVQYSYMSGYPLNYVENAGADVLAQIRMYNVIGLKTQFLEMRLPVLHLLGHASNNLDWETLNDFKVETDVASETYRLLYGYLGRLMLAVYFGEFKFVQNWVESLKAVSSHDSAVESVINRSFFCGLALAGLARLSGQQKFLNMARKEANELKKLIKTRGITSKHRYLIIEAELMTLKKNKDVKKIQDSFDAAIDAAVQASFIHDAALANELLAEFFLRKDNQALASKYFSEARDMYTEWGAVAKIEQLQTNRGSYLLKYKKRNFGTSHTLISRDSSMSFRASAELASLVSSNDDERSQMSFDMPESALQEVA